MPVKQGSSHSRPEKRRDDKKPGSSDGTITSPTQRSGAAPDAELDRPDAERETAPEGKAERLRKTHVERDVTHT